MANIAGLDKTAPTGAVLFGPAIFAGGSMPQLLGSFVFVLIDTEWLRKYS